MDLAPALVDLRRRTLSLLTDLDDAQWRVPENLPVVNPFGWELGHVGWFHERWVLREALGQAPLRADGDALWDSSAVAHATRWHLPLPDRAGTFAYLATVQQRVLAALAEAPSTAVRYHAHYSLLHEAMHVEAFTYMRQTLGIPAPPAAEPVAAGAWPGDVTVEGGRQTLGTEPDADWAFDNEKWAHPVALAPFRIAKAPVTQAEYADFVADGGYQKRALWHALAPVWDGPVYWQGGQRRHFDRLVPHAPDRPMAYVSWFEADAYARWAGRRLPTEAEWDHAAQGATPAGSIDGRFNEPVDVAAFPEADSDVGCRQMLGNTWEWTDSPFLPFPGFVPDPYADYSAPWFGTHRVLRGASFATSRYLVSARYRNFFLPGRRDIPAGFRTVAL